MLVAKTLDEAKKGTGYLQQIGARWEALPVPAKSTAVPPELKELERSIAFAQARLHGKEPALIQSNAGNWPIAHLAMRAKGCRQPR